ncbi:MAG: HAD family phosphatase [Planctomycetes bacterium]|nr:HAD family phosphatase [Planctomycetota bacterium]
MIRAVIFDLGHVLVDVRVADTPRAWAAAAGLDAESVERIYWADTAYERLERGQITLADYHAHLAARLDGPLSLEDFERGWCDIFGEILPGVEALLDRLDGQVRLVCLSNTNAAHTAVWSEVYRDLLSRFERVFTSHTMGARKPEAACFRQVLDYLGLPAAEVAFVDDRAENVDAARALGMHGIVATGAEQVAGDLARLGVGAGGRDGSSPS